MNEIRKLKSEALKHYKKYCNLRDYSDHSCGNHLLEHIVPGMADAKQKFNSVMDQLAKIDPKTPKDRL